MTEQPKGSRTVTGYRFDFVDEKITALVNRIRIHTDGRFTGEVRLTLGTKKQEEPSFQFNFSSSSARKQLVKSLEEKYPEWKADWLRIIDELCRQVQKTAVTGDESSVIQPTTSGVKHPGYYIEPVIMKGVPNVIYGDKGTNKTTLGLAMLGLIALGVFDHPSGLVASKPAKVALLDWENNVELIDYTVSRLVEGGIPYFELPYLRCRHRLVDQIEMVANFLDTHKPDLLMIDSLGKAAGADKFDPGGKTAALDFFDALDQFRVTSLIIGQNAKDDIGKRSIYGSTFFTYYSRNIFRLQASRDKVSEDEMVVALIHEEGNFSRKYPPMGFRLSYTESSISIAKEEVGLSELYDKANQTKVLMEYLLGGSKSVKAIALELGTSDNRTRSLLSKLKSRGLVVNIGSGMWSARAEEET